LTDRAEGVTFVEVERYSCNECCTKDRKNNSRYAGWYSI